MKKKIAYMVSAVAIVLASCNPNFSGNSETDDKDSIDAAKAADSLIQSELQADTSANSDQTQSDEPLSEKTDSMNVSGEGQ
ncbi:hypothetical protein [Pedobacter sp. SYSU D00535]|uniref:hypothetical protein n=1 Tax=Pedobacter sp. SYSU D00535 TaxID=2810308 RepID=UPI001A9725A7|nr:hypothetical protein [Pedobacter sp. SYSU D00535]